MTSTISFDLETIIDLRLKRPNQWRGPQGRRCVDGSRPDDVVALLIAPLLGAAAAMLRLRWLLPLPLSSVLRGHEGRIMTPEEGRQTIRAELTAGLQLTKCQQCGCMQEALDELTACVSTAHTAEADALARDLQAWRAQMQPTRYACLGCAYCYPAVAHNALASALPYISPLPTLQCDFQVHNAQWPPVVGEYLVLDPRSLSAKKICPACQPIVAVCER